MLADILASQGHRVVTAGSVQKALRLIEGERFDVILSDVRMPALDGPSLYATLERTAPDLLQRTCFLSGDTLSPPARVFLPRAQRPLIQKPLTPPEARALVGRVPNAPRQPAHAPRPRAKTDRHARNPRHTGQ